MHSYSIDTNERTKVTVFLSVLSIIFILMFDVLFNKYNISFPKFFNGPSMMSIFWLFYWIFDNYAWKCDLFRKINLIKTPILEGRWNGKYHSEQRCKKTNEIIKSEGEVELIIKQNWTTLSIIQKSKNSKSCSEFAGIAINDNMGIVLNYQYRNETKSKSPESMHSHIGFNKLHYSPEEQTLEGNYFTDRDRQTHGILLCKKIKVPI